MTVPFKVKHQYVEAEFLKPATVDALLNLVMRSSYYDSLNGSFYMTRAMYNELCSSLKKPSGERYVRDRSLFGRTIRIDEKMGLKVGFGARKEDKPKEASYE